MMLRYVPVNIAVPHAPASVPRLAQATPAPRPEPPAWLPSVAVNVAIIAGGVGIGLLGFHHRKSPVGAIALGAGGSVVGAGVIFLLLDLIGFKPRV